jgi:hypothetical protein
MGCSQDDYEAINELGTRVYDTLYANPLIYPNPPKTNVQLKTVLDLSIDAQSNVKGGGKQATTRRNNRSKVLHDMLEQEILTYVNGLWRGNKENLELSGFPVSKEPEPHGVPETPVIKRIEKGPVPGSVKIILEPRSGSDIQKKERLMYFVYKGTDPINSTTDEQVLTTSNSKAIIITGVQRAVDYFYTLFAHNGKNGSELATKVRFMLN